MNRTQGVRIAKALVDTGSEYTWVRGANLEKIGVIREKKDLRFLMANGQVVRKLLPALSCMFLAAAAAAADRPYNEAADAKLEIKQALTQAAAAKIPVLVVFGANWCGDCLMLDTAMNKGASAPLLARDFKTVKVNVGKFDQNLEIAKSYAVPLDKGIPAVAIVSASNELQYATRAGELANARKMGDTGIYEFFKRVAPTTAAPSANRACQGSPNVGDDVRSL